MTSATKMRVELWLRQGGILDGNGRLTKDAVRQSTRIILTDEVIRNPEVVKTLTSDGSNIADWGKYTTRSIRSNGQSLQVHFYE